jgi:hypothetical protein
VTVTNAQGASLVHQLRHESVSPESFATETAVVRSVAQRIERDR